MLGLERILIVSLLAPVCACGTIELFGTYDAPESAEVAATPWPRLVDVPEAPEVGTYTDAVPDPAQGVALQADLDSVAGDAALRAEKLGQPVLDEADLEVLKQAPRKRPEPQE
ncbi:hypothetical protein KHP62_10710 [Rhodobacteraceae bacterium NNCM2]|nr:hypothetical protein [Coraliihabitans acroporae]